MVQVVLLPRRHRAVTAVPIAPARAALVGLIDEVVTPAVLHARRSTALDLEATAEPFATPPASPIRGSSRC